MVKLNIGDAVICRTGTGFQQHGTITEFDGETHVMVDCDSGPCVFAFRYAREVVSKVEGDDA